MSTNLKLVAILAAVVIGLTGCGEDASDGGAGGGGTELVVEAQDFSFEVEGSTTIPEAGEEVSVRLVNEGEAPHTFSSEEVDLDVEADPGAEGEGTFTVSDDGAIDFQCNIHPDQMKLTLTAGEPATSGGSDDSEDDKSEDDGGGDDGLDY